MDLDAVPQEGNATLGGQRKVMYARGEGGRMVMVPSRGWEAEEIVTQQALAAIESQATDAWARHEAGAGSTLEVWMYERRMDVAFLSQTSGFWAWQVRRHLRPGAFAKLSPQKRQRYANALGVRIEQLEQLP